MADNPVARLGDTSSHGGSIVTSAQHQTVEGKLVARVTDLLDCPVHGLNPIVTGCPVWTSEGQRVARSGSTTACGATIIGGATRTVCD